MNTKRSVPPADIAELMLRARSLAGLTLASLCAQMDREQAGDLRREKGWTGQLLEQALGAHAGSLSQPDFPDLGVELKTIPVDSSGAPLESTWVTVAPLTATALPVWEHSIVRLKLSKVLWIPILAQRDIPLHQRLVGLPLLWQPSAAQEEHLRRDYEEICERIALGELDLISASHGDVLQLRPKAANRDITVSSTDSDGAPALTSPRGFYLRRSFTRTILQAAYFCG